MTFLTNFTGSPLPTAKPIRHGSYHVLLTSNGFVVGDPLAFQDPKLLDEIASLRTRSGFINGHLHLHSTRFPLYYPGSSPRLLLSSRHLTVMPLGSVSSPMMEAISGCLPSPQDLGNPNPDLLRNVLISFEIYEDGGSREASSHHCLI